MLRPTLDPLNSIRRACDQPNRRHSRASGSGAKIIAAAEIRLKKGGISIDAPDAAVVRRDGLCAAAVRRSEGCPTGAVWGDPRSEEKIWVKQSVGGHVVAFTMSADGVGLTGESHVVPNPKAVAGRFESVEFLKHQR
jgi:hypothetical protein